MNTKGTQSLITIIILVLAAGALILAAWLWYQIRQDDEVAQISSFEECVAAGYPVAESHPRQCRTPDGQSFVEEINEEAETEYTSDGGEIIRLSSPRANDLVTSPLRVTGEARGSWSFEADFPVELRTADGELVATGIATMQDDWMTEEYVAFEAVIEFERPDAQEGVLVLIKDNPSGLPENDDQVEVPISFN